MYFVHAIDTTVYPGCEWLILLCFHHYSCSASHTPCKPHEQVPAEISRLQSELDELGQLRDNLQSSVDDLTSKLLEKEKELNATHSKYLLLFFF